MTLLVSTPFAHLEPKDEARSNKTLGFRAGQTPAIGRGRTPGTFPGRQNSLHSPSPTRVTPIASIHATRRVISQPPVTKYLVEAEKKQSDEPTK
jgi:hypothetical protein